MQEILALIPDHRNRNPNDQKNIEYSKADEELIEGTGGQVPSQ